MSIIATRIESIETRRMDDYDPDLSWLEDPSRYDGCSPEEVAKYVAQDAERLEDYGRSWSMIGIDARAIVYIRGVRQEITSGGLWGIESDSDESYLREVEDDAIVELGRILHEMGFTDDVKAVRAESC